MSEEDFDLDTGLSRPSDIVPRSIDPDFAAMWELQRRLFRLTEEESGIWEGAKVPGPGRSEGVDVGLLADSDIAGLQENHRLQADLLDQIKKFWEQRG